MRCYIPEEPEFELQSGTENIYRVLNPQQWEINGLRCTLERCFRRYGQYGVRVPYYRKIITFQRNGCSLSIRFFITNHFLIRST